MGKSPLLLIIRGRILPRTPIINTEWDPKMESVGVPTQQPSLLPRIKSPHLWILRRWRPPISTLSGSIWLGVRYRLILKKAEMSRPTTASNGTKGPRMCGLTSRLSLQARPSSSTTHRSPSSQTTRCSNIDATQKMGLAMALTLLNCQLQLITLLWD